MVGTKTANSFLMGVVQIGSYSVFGAMSLQIWIYALALGIGGTIGNIIGKKLLKNMKSKSFRKWVIAVLLISGISMIWEVIVGLN